MPLETLGDAPTGKPEARVRHSHIRIVCRPGSCKDGIIQWPDIGDVKVLAVRTDGTEEDIGHTVSRVVWDATAGESTKARIEFLGVEIDAQGVAGDLSRVARDKVVIEELFGLQGAEWSERTLSGPDRVEVTVVGRQMVGPSPGATVSYTKAAVLAPARRSLDQSRGLCLDALRLDALVHAAVSTRVQLYSGGLSTIGCPELVEVAKLRARRAAIAERVDPEAAVATGSG